MRLNSWRMAWSTLVLSAVGLCWSSGVLAQSPPESPPGGGSTGGNYTGGGTGGSGGSGGTNPGGDPGYGGGTGGGSGMLGETSLSMSLPMIGGGTDGQSCCGASTTFAGWSSEIQAAAAKALKACAISTPKSDTAVCDAVSQCSSCGGSNGQPGHDVAVLRKPNAGGGCAECGGATPPSGGSSVDQSTNYEAGRAFRPDDRALWSSFGPGMFSNYDTRINLYPDASGGVNVRLYDAINGRQVELNDGLNGDTLDGTYSAVQQRLAESLVLKDASGNTVTSVSSAATAVLKQWGGSQQTFEIVNLQPAGSTPEYVGRLKSITDANQHTLTITYRDSLPSTSGGFTAQQLSESPTRRLQLYQVTDWQGDVATYNYLSTQVSGRWAVSSIVTPASGTVSYAYTNGFLSSTTANGFTKSISYVQDPVAQTTVATMRADECITKSVHLTNDYMTITQSGQPTLVSQPVGVIRMIANAGGEAEYMMVPDQTTAGIINIYGGAGVVARITVGQSVKYYTDGWTVSSPGELNLANGTLETTYSATPNATTAQLYSGAIPAATDQTGRQYAYEYDARSFMTKKTFVADSTYEQYAYNAQQQLTRLRDRQGNVTQFEYDSRGNLTKVKQGLKEVGGQDVAQAEYTERQWAYYPAGHYAAGLLQTEFDANWDGSSTDTHRTDYEYNARGNVTKRIGPASAAGSLRPETLWTYDAQDRVTSVVDPQGHTISYAYDSASRVITTTYDDSTTEQRLYGASGSGQEALVLKSKDRRNVVTSYSYDNSGRVTQVIVGSAYDANILDGQADDTPITDRNQKSITSYTYLAGTDHPVSVSRDGSVTNLTYDYQQRVISTKVFPYAGKMLESQKTYVANKLFSEEDPYGRKKYYGYRASDGQLIRYVTGAYPGITLADQTAVFALTRSTVLNPDYTIRDAITDQNGRPETVIDERGTISKTVYDTAGRVIQQIAAFGTSLEAKTETIYDDAGNALEVRSPRYFDANDVNGYQKCKTVMTYDGAGRVLSRTEAPGTAEAGTESYTYDLDGRQKTRTDARGKVWTTTYASCCGHTVSSKNPLGHGSVTNQNAGGLTVHTAGIEDVDSHTSLLNPTDNKTLQETTTKYDALGRSVASTVWLQPLGLVDVNNPPIAGLGGVAGTQGLTTQTLYDADLTDNSGLETTTGITVTNPLGGTYTVSLAAAITKLGQPVAQGGAGITLAAGTPGSAVVNINAENEISFSISDAQGRSLMSGILHPHDAVSPNTPGALLTWSCQVPDITETINSQIYLTRLSVDALGNTTQSRSNGLGHTVQSVDQAGNISSVQYDAGGNIIVSRNPSNIGADSTYNATNRIISSTDTAGNTVQTQYDRAGNKIASIDAKNKTTSYTYDARGRRRSETNRLNHTTTWTYDAAGHTLSMTDPENQTTSYQYDDAGRKTVEQYPDHVGGSAIGSSGYGLVTFTCDAIGRMKTRQNQQGDICTFNNDMASRLQSRSYLGHVSGPRAGQTTADTFTHDREGRTLTATSQQYSNTVTFQFDDRGQIVSESLAVGGQTYNIATTYDVLGRMSQLTYPSGEVITHTYTSTGQLQTVSRNGVVLSTRTYNPSGRLLTNALGNGLTTTWTWNSAGLPSSISTPNVGSHTWAYDANDNLTSETLSGVMQPYGFTATYDDEDRLLSWTRADNNNNHSWNLSPVGNWTTFTSGNVTETRTYGQAHELTAIAGGPNAGSINFDPNGSITTLSTGHQYTYDFENMLKSVTIPTGSSSGTPGVYTYTYDAFRRRVSEILLPIGNSQTTRLYVNRLVRIPPDMNNGGQVLCEYENGFHARSFVNGTFVDELISLIDSTNAGSAPQGIAETLYFHQNCQYSVTAMTDSGGNTAERYHYSPFGNRRIFGPNCTDRTQSSYANRRQFTGREFDEANSQTNFRQRVASSIGGIFTQRDETGYADSASRYLLLPNSSLTSTDPSGHKCNILFGPDVQGPRLDLIDTVDPVTNDRHIGFEWFFAVKVAFADPCSCCHFQQFISCSSQSWLIDQQGKKTTLPNIDPQTGELEEDCIVDQQGIRHCYGDRQTYRNKNGQVNNVWDKCTFEMSDRPFFKHALNPKQLSGTITMCRDCTVVQIITDSSTKSIIWNRTISLQHCEEFVFP